MERVRGMVLSERDGGIGDDGWGDEVCMHLLHEVRGERGLRIACSSTVCSSWMMLYGEEEEEED